MEHNRRQADQSIIKAVLRSEVTWVIMVIGFVSWFYKDVAIPIREIQLQIHQVQIDIAKINTDRDKQIAEHKEYESRLDKLEAIVNTIR